MSLVRPVKRVEVIIMRKVGILAEAQPVTEAARKAYEEFFNKELCNENLNAVKELFPSLARASPIKG